MNIFISGISGTGMGPLALFAHDAGHQVFGSDLHEGPITKELKAKNLTFAIGPQTGDYLSILQPLPNHILNINAPRLLVSKLVSAMN